MYIYVTTVRSFVRSSDLLNTELSPERYWWDQDPRTEVGRGVEVATLSPPE